MKQILFLIITTAMLSAPLALIAGQREDQLYNAMMGATFTDEKTRVAEELARLGTADARTKLLAALEDRSSWNREAAARGLALIGDPEVSRALFDRMLTDRMIDTAVRDAFVRTIGLHADYLAGRYASSPDRQSREAIIGIMGGAKVPRGEAFLKKIVEDVNSGDRALAFESLARNYPANNYAYIKGYRDTVPLRFHALAYLADNGTAEDLPLFRDIIDRKEEPKYMLVAFKAVNRLGDAELKQRVFVDALAGKDQGIAQGAMYIFTGVRSDRAMELLCRLVKTGETQQVRMTALSRLREYTSRDIVPSLVLGLDERFMYHERGGGDIFASIITIGISSIFDDLYQKQRKKVFESSKQDIANHLKRITGADNGTSGEKWTEWAVLNGYSINGANIIQYLFSGYRATRDRAAESAIRLLGYASTREFYARNGSFASDSELSLALARMLVAKGYLREEKY
jgi:hypothetical protein